MLVYRLAVTFALPAVLAGFLWRILRGAETAGDLAERIGGGGTGQSGAIWVHGASNGELTSARRLIGAIAEAFPDRALVVTANTVTGRELAAGWGLARVTARLAPLDWRPALARFRARWRPAALVVLENELWPNRMATAREPVVFVAARISGQSAARWARFGGALRGLLARVAWLAPQDTASGARFVSLGLDPARLAPVVALKSGVELPAPPAAELARLRGVFDRAKTVLAASTHEGEEDAVLAAFEAARRGDPALRLILAPRHTRRSAEVEALIRARGLSVAVRSRGEAPEEATAVYLADTLGEMALFYALAGATFVGGSLVDRGGHTPFEPAAAGSAILHGPHVGNFAGVYGALDAAGGALPVADARALAAALGEVASTGRQAELAGTARAALDRLGDAGEGVAEVVRVLRRLIA